MKSLANCENKRSASFPDVSSMLKRQRSDLERKLRNLHFVHCVEKVELIDQYDPNCWVCQKESTLVKDLKSTLAEHRRLGILDDELQLLNKGYQKWILSLEAGHGNCSTKAVTISNAIKKALFNRSSDSLPEKLEKDSDEKDKMISFKIGSQQSQPANGSSSPDSVEAPVEELGEEGDRSWSPVPIDPTLKRPSQRKFKFDSSDEEEDNKMPPKKRQRQSESGVMVRDEESLTEYFKPTTPPSAKKSRLTERQKEVLSAKKDKLPFIEDESQQSASNSMAVLKKRLPSEYFLDSQQDSENLSQNAMDAIPVKEDGEAKSPLKDSQNSQNKPIGPIDFSGISDERSPSRTPSQGRSPARNESPARSSAHRSQSSTPKGSQSKKDLAGSSKLSFSDSSETKKSSTRVLRPRSPSSRMIEAEDEEDEALEESENESDQSAEKRSPSRNSQSSKKRRRKRKNKEVVDVPKEDKASKTDPPAQKKEEKQVEDEAKRIRKERLQAMLGKPKPVEPKSPLALTKTRSSSNLELIIPAKPLIKPSSEEAKPEENEPSEDVSTKNSPIKEINEKADGEDPKKPSEPTEVLVEFKEEVKEKEADSQNDSVVIIDEVLKTPPRSQKPVEEGTPQSILRKQETPKSVRSDRRVTFNVESERRFKTRKAPAVDCIAPELVYCNDSITSMCMKLAPKKQGIRLDNILKRKSIWTIGDFAGLSPSVINQMPFIREPKMENVNSFLASFKPTANSHGHDRPSIQSTPLSTQKGSPPKTEVTFNSTLNETPIKKRDFSTFSETSSMEKIMTSTKNSSNVNEELVEDSDNELKSKPESQEEMEVEEDGEGQKANEKVLAKENINEKDNVNHQSSPQKAQSQDEKNHTPVRANTSKRICTPMPSRSALAMLSTDDDDFYDDSILEGFEMPKETIKSLAADNEHGLNSKLTEKFEEVKEKVVDNMKLIEKVDQSSQGEFKAIHEKLDKLLQAKDATNTVDLNNMDALAIVKHLHSQFLVHDPPPSSTECNMLSSVLCQFLNDVNQRQLMNHTK